MKWRVLFAAGLAFMFGLARHTSVRARQPRPTPRSRRPPQRRRKLTLRRIPRSPSRLRRSRSRTSSKTPRPSTGSSTFTRQTTRSTSSSGRNSSTRPIMVSLTCESGIGERGFYAAQMCGEMPVVFHKQAKNVQLRREEHAVPAADSTAFHRAIDRSFSDSILGATKIESLPHPDRKSVLIDLGAAAADRFSDAGVHAGSDVPDPLSLRREEQLLRRDQRIREERRDRHGRALRGRAAAASAAAGSRARRRHRRRRRRATCPTCAA